MIKLIDTTLHRKLISQTYKFDIEGVIVSCTHIFEYDEIGEYYFEDYLFDIELEDDTIDEIKEYIGNL